MSGEMKLYSSENSMRHMKVQQHTEMMAPVTVGCVRSFGTFRYTSSLRMVHRTEYRVSVLPIIQSGERLNRVLTTNKFKVHTNLGSKHHMIRVPGFNSSDRFRIRCGLLRKQFTFKMFY